MAGEPAEGDLRIWWIPQIPMKPFIWPVADLAEGRLLIDALAAYDAFQFEHRVKPDYSNAGGLQVWEAGEWVDWSDAAGDDITAEKYRFGGSGPATPERIAMINDRSTWKTCPCNALHAHPCRG